MKDEAQPKGAGAEFRTDLSRALQAINSSHHLVWITIAFAAPSIIWAAIPVPQELSGGVFGLLNLVTVVLLFYEAGWLGAQRILYLRVWRGQPESSGDIADLIRDSRRRYLILGVICGIPTWVLVLMLYRASGVSSSSAATGGVLLVATLPFILGDVLLTFVTPALAYSTRSVREALRIGFKMLHNEWPSNAWHVLTPALTFAMVTRVPRAYSGSSWLQVGMVITSALIALLARGTIASFYERHAVLGRDGAAWRDRVIATKAQTTLRNRSQKKKKRR